MGSQVDSKDEFTVLVTGFGPFKAAYPVNPSWEIARHLPSHLPSSRSSSKPAAPETNTYAGNSELPEAPLLPPVRILVHPEAIPVNYQVVRKLVPTLWGDDGRDSDSESKSTEAAETAEAPRRNRNDSGNRYDDNKAPPPPPHPYIDLCIHIGMAGPRMHYSIEHRGHRDGYTMPDVDGEKLGDEHRRREQGGDWVWAGAPGELETDLDVRDVLARWRRHSPDDADLRISEDAGHYLCDFIYFSSLAHLYRRRENRRVIFLHVPCNGDELAVALGRELALSLIRALVESELERRREAEVRASGSIAIKLRV